MSAVDRLLDAYAQRVAEDGIWRAAKAELDEQAALDAATVTMLDELKGESLVGSAVRCKICGMTKKPIGRSAPLGMANGLCDHECDGYLQEPQVGTLWPGETSEDFGCPIRAFGSDKRKS